MSYEDILNEALGRVPDSLDKREGSVIYDAIAPAAAVLAQAYIAMDAELKDVFIVSGSEETLEKRGAELGIERHEATAAVVRGAFNMDVPVGSRFNLDDMNYIVIQTLPKHEAILQCETAGSDGNRTGTLFPIDYIDGLTSAKIAEVITPGEDIEDKEHYRSRLLEYMQRPITSGNRYHYESWAKEVSGVGRALCQPLWNGPGTVRVLITDDEQQPASETLCQLVAAHIEEVRPVGADVTVASPDAKTIDVSVKLSLAPGTYLDTVRQRLSDSLKKYLASLVFSKSYVSMAFVGSLIMDTEGVADYESLMLNGSAANVAMETSEIPVLGNVEVSV